MQLSLRAHEAIAHPCVVPDGQRERMWWRFVGVDSARSAAAAVARWNVPILACVGGNGSGKTACAVYTVLPTLEGVRWKCTNPAHLHPHAEDCTFRRLKLRSTCDCPLRDEHSDYAGPVPGESSGWRYVLSTVRLTLPDGTDHPNWRPFVGFGQLLDAEHCDVLMDEVTGVASSRQHQSLPVQVENLIVQLRRRDARLIWTTPDYAAADLRIRTVTRAVVYARGFLHVRPAADTGRLWREARGFKWSLYNAEDFDAFTAGKRERLRPDAVQFVWRPGHALETAYNTLDSVAALGVATEGGMCLSCGGGKSRPRCTCPPDPAALGGDVVEEVTNTGARRRRLRSADEALASPLA